MIGSIQSKANITGVVKAVETIIGEVTAGCVIGDVELGRIVVEQVEGETYDGVYDITPTVEEQTLETRGKKMRDDVTILEIPYYTTTNLSGGYTAIIGGN